MGDLNEMTSTDDRRNHYRDHRTSVGKQTASLHKTGASSGLFLASHISFATVQFCLSKRNHYGHELQFWDFTGHSLLEWESKRL